MFKRRLQVSTGILAGLSLLCAVTPLPAQFGLSVVTTCPGVPSEILWPRDTWGDKGAYDAAAKKLARLFSDNFKQYAGGVNAEVRAASPAV